jgi:death on curing protein
MWYHGGMLPDELGIGDFLLIAEAVLGISAEQLAWITQIPQAESALAAPFANFGGVNFYPDPAQRAAICCSRVVRNHPLPDGNKRIAYECMREMLDRSRLAWPRPTEDAPLIAMVIEGLAASNVSEGDFVRWVQLRLESA